MADNKKNLLLLFQRPAEPLFTKKNDGKAAFDVPDQYLTDRYKPIGQELQTRFGENVETRIPLPNISPPDISFATVLDKTTPISLFNTTNKQIAGRLIKLFMDQPDVTSFLATAAYVKDRVNTYLFQYSLAVATAHRPDTKDLPLPSIVQIFPSHFIDSSVFPKAREEAALVSPANRMVLDIPLKFTASDKELEQRLSYFREDIGVNSHHWHWHLVYPGDGEDVIVNKDRRGELFFYMHNQLIARYNVERIANGLPKVKPITNFREPILEAYFPKIIRSVSNRAYPPRVANTVMTDLDRPADNAAFQISEMELWRDRIFDAIDKGFVVDSNGNNIPLTPERGIDILGNVVEPSSLSPNRRFYGELHSYGHDAIGFSHDPDGRFLETLGVMGDLATVMRDPVFYRWHSFVDFVFLRHKNLLPPYTPATDFDFSGVSVDSVSVKITKGNTPPNALLNYWQKTDVDLGVGLDFAPEGNVFASFTHLQFAPFDYHIAVNNNSGVQRRGTCRIFMGPKVDDQNNTLSFRDQRNLMIELDKFTVMLNPGQNTIRRRSDESSVTIPYEQTFRNLSASNVGSDLAQFQFCGCGWPAHLLLPRGSAAGTAYDLFVMVTNHEDDAVNQEGNPSVTCNDAASFCGLKDQKYPDRRPMGYPFDRPSPAATLADFAGATQNMAVGTFTIRFVDTYVKRT